MTNKKKKTVTYTLLYNNNIMLNTIYYYYDILYGVTNSYRGRQVLYKYYIN